MKNNIANSLILLVVASGTALLSFIDVTALGLVPVKILFIIFVAVIVSIQLLPVIMFCGARIKGLVFRLEKHSEL